MTLKNPYLRPELLGLEPYATIMRCHIRIEKSFTQPKKGTD